MEVEFEDEQLSLVESENAAKLKLPVAVIQSARRKLHVIRSAPDERTLRNWKSLHYEKLRGDREEQRSIRLNDQWRLVFRLDTQCSPPKVIVVSIEDYH